MDLQKNEIGFSEVLHLRLTMWSEHVWDTDLVRFHEL